MLNKILYLPVEVKRRSFLSKLFLGYKSLTYGYEFIIGGHGSVKEIALNGPDGIYLEKDFFGIRSEFFEKFKNRDMKFYALDEEGLVFLSEENYINNRVDYDNLKYLEKILVWGERQKDILTKNFDNNILKKIEIVGNPRIDILGNIGENIYKKQIEIIKKKHGEYILFNSNFGLVNNVKTIDEILNIVKNHKKNIDEKEIENTKNFYSYSKKIFQLTVEALLEIAKDKSINLVIRPHPSEKISTWEKIFKDYPNVIVNNQYDVFPWIFNANLIIHNGCTTGLESFILGKYVLSYEPITSDQFDQKLPNSVSIRVFNKKDLLTTIKKIFKNKEFKNKEFKEDDYKKKNIINKNILINEEFSADRIIKIFNQNKYNNKDHYIYTSKKNIAKDFFRLLYIKIIKKENYGLKKFDYLSKKEIKHYIKILNTYFIDDYNIKIKKISSNTYLISKE